MKEKTIWKERIRTTRDELCLTQERLAKILNVSIHTVQSWEYKGTVPRRVYQYSIETLRRAYDETC